MKAIGITGLPVENFSYVMDRSKVEVDIVLSYCHNCLNDTALRDIVPYLQGKGVGIINASALCMGLLTKSGGPVWHPAPEELKQVAKKANDFCEERSADLALLALQYSLAYEPVSTTLVGMETIERVDACLAAASKSMDESLLRDVLEIFEPVHNLSWPSGKIAQ